MNINDGYTLQDVGEIIGAPGSTFVGAGGVGTSVEYADSSGHNTYIFTMGATDGGAVAINDTSGQGTLVIQSGLADQLTAVGIEAVPGGYLGEFPSGDTVIAIGTIQSFTSGVGGFLLDLTAMAAGTSFSTIEIGGYI